MGIGLWNEESDKEPVHNLEPQRLTSLLCAHLELFLLSLNAEAFTSTCISFSVP